MQNNNTSPILSEIGHINDISFINQFTNNGALHECIHFQFYIH